MSIFLSAATVASVGPAERLELLSAYGDAPVPAVAGEQVQDDTVDERRDRHQCWSRLLVVQAIERAVMLRLLARDDVDNPTTTAAAELDGTLAECEQRVVVTAADVLAGVEVRAALPHDDLAGVHELDAEALHAEPLRVGVTTVARG
jgi:hypothetical protein